MKDRDQTIYALRNSKGKVFTIGDKFTTPQTLKSKDIVLGKVSRRKMRISGFEAHGKGWYVLYMPQYSNGVIEKNPKKAWRCCDLEEAILIK